MGTVLLVEPTPEEEAALCDGRPGEGWRRVPADELRSVLAAGPPPDAVVVGSRADDVLPLVQQVHAADALTAVAVLTRPDDDADLRRAVSYAPGVPSGLLVVGADDPAVAEKVRALVEAARTERRHRVLLASVAAQVDETTSHAPLPRSLGTLLQRAPFGVLVTDLDGRLVAWNPWAGDLLALADDAAGQHVTAVFGDPGPLRVVFAAAREHRLDAPSPTLVLRGPLDARVEVNAVPSELDSGDPAVLLLVQDVTERFRAEERRDRLAAHVGLLGQVSEALAGMLDAEAALRRLAQEVVPVLADWVSLQIYDARGNARRVAVHHHDPARSTLVETVQANLPHAVTPEAPSRRIARGEGPLLIGRVSPTALARLLPEPEALAALGEIGVGSVVAVPLPGRDGVLGSMVLVNEPSSPRFTDEDLAVATEVGRRAGITLETIALYAEQSELAAQLQRSLLTEPPASEHGHIAVRYLAAAEEAQVGGDWYDAFVQPDGGTVLVIGDVIGHDTRAAAAMGQLRSLLRGIGFTTGTGPSEILCRLDAAMSGLDVRTTATAVVTRIEQVEHQPGLRRVRWSNAGHPPPVLVTEGRPARVLEAEECDLLLGVVADAARQEHELLLGPGSTLLLYTDGLVERRGQALDAGVDALLAAVDEVAQLPLQEMADQVLARMLPAALEDDVALLAVRLGQARG